MVIQAFTKIIIYVQNYGIRYAICRFLKKVFRVLKHIPKVLRVPFVWVYQKNGGKVPLVSFVFPVYNVEKFLPQAMDTILSQTMKHIEIIAVDDGSTDRSLEILNQYAAKDGRVKVFTQKNQYAGVARNLGLSKAKGEYVVFLDSDDFFAKELAQDAYYTAKVNRADIVLFGAKHFDNTTQKYKEAPWLLRVGFAPEIQPFSWRECPERLYQITSPCPWTKMFRREFILNSGLQFQNLRNSNDVYFTYCALVMAKRIVTLNRPLVYYRVGLLNNLQATKKKDPLCFYKAYLAVKRKLTELGVMDELRPSYVNAVLSSVLYNLRTQSNPEAKQLVSDAIKNEVLDELELTGYERDFYYNQADYEEMQSIIGKTYDNEVEITTG